MCPSSCCQQLLANHVPLLKGSKYMSFRVQGRDYSGAHASSHSSNICMLRGDMQTYYVCTANTAELAHAEWLHVISIL